MILQLLFLLQIIKHKECNNSAKILELLWHAYISKLVKAQFGINCILHEELPPELCTVPQ